MLLCTKNYKKKVYDDKTAKFFLCCAMNMHDHKKNRGPFPLPVHLAMACSDAAQLEAYPQPLKDFAARYQVQITDQSQRAMIKGLQQYQMHSYVAPEMHKVKIWEKEGAAIFALNDATKPSSKSAILLIPSLINTGDILDLIPERSLMRWLSGQGHTAYLLDWGHPEKHLKGADMEHMIRVRLVSAIKALAQKTGGPINVLGYCMGGTMLLAAATYCTKSIKKIVLLATPWDFHAGHQVLSDRVRVWAPLVLPQIQLRGCMPAMWTQSLFATLDSAEALMKYSRFADMDMNSEAAQLFVAVEDWLNKGCDLPQYIAHHCIQEWFSKNAPARGEWELWGDHVDLQKIENDVLVIASDKDRLVPEESAKAVLSMLEHANTYQLEVSCGHIGFIAGASAINDVWEPLSDWLMEE